MCDEKKLEATNTKDSVLAEDCAEVDETASKPRKKSIREFFEDYTGDTRQEEYDWGCPVGDEVF